MPWRLLASVAVVCCLAVMVAGAPASADDSQPYVKYYAVAARYQGQPETITEIAIRFLGSGDRSSEIYNLNAGRVQPDGASLVDPAKLNAGWYLILPWDAVGDGVVIGQLPTGAQPASPTPTRSKAAVKPSSAPAPSHTPAASPTPQASASVSTSPGCPATAASSNPSDWAQLRMAASGAWDLSRGNGVMVAVVDSGVDGGLQQLSGRIAVGADVTVGNGRGDIDCLGTGTAMASVIGADTSGSNTPVGMAPDATILPARMVTTSANAKAADAANAIEVAISAGASVVALGSYVDLTAPAVVSALSTALDHDVIVVACAPTRSLTRPSPSKTAATGALLLVGGVDVNNQLVETYQSNTVDVVAPGADVASIGPGSAGTLSYTGTQYAVAFVAGEAALIRAAFPALTAAQVRQRIQSTAGPVQSGSPDDRYGSGIINPAASVTRTGSGGPSTSTASGGGHGGSTGAALLIFGLLLLLGGGVGLAIWYRRRAI
jgi:hypothetical protein